MTTAAPGITAVPPKPKPPPSLLVAESAPNSNPLAKLFRRDPKSPRRNPKSSRRNPNSSRRNPKSLCRWKSPLSPNRKDSLSASNTTKKQTKKVQY
jgi:hypothetical protein